VILISDKADFKPKLLRRYKESHYILIKRTIHQENITIVNMYALNVVAPSFIYIYMTNEQKGTDRSKYNTTVGVLKWVTSVSHSSRQKVNKETLELYFTKNQMDLTDIYKKLDSRAGEYTLFLEPYGIVPLRHSILGHKANLSKSKK
jgi:hypothetical protein